jgi:hypothetical protein
MILVLDAAFTSRSGDKSWFLFVVTIFDSVKEDLLETPWGKAGKEGKKIEMNEKSRKMETWKEQR